MSIKRILIGFDENANDRILAFPIFKYVQILYLESKCKDLLGLKLIILDTKSFLVHLSLLKKLKGND